MRTRSELYDYQEEAIDRIRIRQQQAIFLKMGLGKTVIALSALKDMGVRQTLVFAPARVVELDVWGTEAVLWEHLQNVTVVPCVGSALQRTRILQETANKKNCLVVLSYDNLWWYTSMFRVGRQEKRWGAIVFDELSRLKSPGTKRFKAQRNWLKNIPVRIGMTGTPVGNHLMDLWGEMYTVAGEAPLGPTFGMFKQRYFYPVDPNGWKWVPHANTQKNLQERIKPFAFTISENLGPKTPLVRVNEVAVELPQAVKEQMRTLVVQLRVELEEQKELVALGASTVAGKLRQFASGAVFLSKDEVAHVHDEKLKALDELLEEQQGDPVLLFYHYTHELARMKARYKQARVLGETCTMEEWNSGKVELMLAHPQSSGFGLNLQEGGSTLCWYTLPWSVELWEQATARLARQGQRSAIVTSHVLLAGPVDEMVLKVLRNKGRIQSEVLEALSL